MTSVGWDSGGIVRLVGPRRRVPRDDLEPLFLRHDPCERLRAPKALSLVGFVEEDLADLGPGPCQDLLPLLTCSREPPVALLLVGEIPVCDFDERGVVVDSLHDELRHLE